MEKVNRPGPTTDSEIREAIRILQEHPRGLNRQTRERAFGSDRKARQLLSEVASQGIAVIINAKDPILGDVMRLAETEEERQLELRTLRSRIQQLERRYAGLQRASLDGPILPQRSLF